MISRTLRLTWWACLGVPFVLATACAPASDGGGPQRVTRPSPGEPQPIATAAGASVPAQVSLPARNVILYVVDSLRADRLGAYGYDRGTTPNLDALARWTSASAASSSGSASATVLTTSSTEPEGATTILVPPLQRAPPGPPPSLDHWHHFWYS